MGTENSVSFLFKHCGQFLFAPGTDEATLMDAALEAGAEDVVADEEGGFEVLCAPNDFAAVKEALEGAGFKAEVAEIVMKPATETVFTGDDAVKMQKLLDALENLDDTQEVYTNAVIEEWSRAGPGPAKIQDLMQQRPAGRCFSLRGSFLMRMFVHFDVVQR